MLATRFARQSPILRSRDPLSDDQIRTVAPSIFADAPHASRTERFTYIPTSIYCCLKRTHHQVDSALAI